MTRLTRCLALLGLVGGAVGYATAAPAQPASTQPASADVGSLNGTWMGFQTGRSTGARQPLTIVITDGTYVASFGRGFSSNGTVAVADGKITVVRTGGSGGGGSTLAATSTAVIEQRQGRRVLVGHGRNDFGPFSYELTEQK